MTPALKTLVEAMISDLGQQAANAPTPFVTFLPEGARVEMKGTFDLEKVARVGLEAMRYTDADKQTFIATADRHEIRPLVLISAYNELLDRAREP